MDAGAIDEEVAPESSFGAWDVTEEGWVTRVFSAEDSPVLEGVESPGASLGHDRGV